MLIHEFAKTFSYRRFVARAVELANLADGPRIRNRVIFQEPRSLRMQIVKIILAIFLPPAAAFLQVNFTLHFWINFVLTLLGGIPGMLHALWLVLTDQS